MSIYPSVPLGKTNCCVLSILIWLFALALSFLRRGPLGIDSKQASLISLPWHAHNATEESSTFCLGFAGTASVIRNSIYHNLVRVAQRSNSEQSLV
ncbi:hypothetical protein BS50DRAFT_141604 [Corynespora cassiicola Philippines]|uniref:Uncharacterized protein n=1 Tax=Corynespora cassiicola Philippines TaxID=1448308 RepID=A0A2T2N9Y4_CORCC|nr:hypothetical protein BS50DRAFT_141604 [Corynespora cassiicola Philippines]